MANIYLVRHGQASFGAENYDQLSELGMRQCALLGQWMRQTGQQVDRLILGAMQRHQQSAMAFWEGYGSPAHLQQANWQLESGLNEFDHLQMVQLSRPELGSSAQLMQFLAEQKQPRQVFEQVFSEALVRWMSGSFDREYAESWCAFQTRIHHAMLKLVPDDSAMKQAQNAIVFTSGGPISVACQKLLAIPDSNLMSMMSVLVNSGVSKLMVRDGRLSLASINNVAHLEQHADRSLISYR